VTEVPSGAVSDEQSGLVPEYHRKE